MVSGTKYYYQVKTLYCLINNDHGYHKDYYMPWNVEHTDYYRYKISIILGLTNLYNTLLLPPSPPGDPPKIMSTSRPYTLKLFWSSLPCSSLQVNIIFTYYVHIYTADLKIHP